jgi:glycosyltransferase involved in cell wall biosynthesis/2-polyprenyl-3-methyl-5-hydroxy-6-metoxy-1,4-benzoquinol methylase
MRIGYILIGPHVSGGQRVVHEHLTHLQKRGHEVGLYFMNGATTHWLQHDYPLVTEDWLRTADIVVATSWMTADALNPFQTSARKFYLVQGRESMFLPEFEARSKMGAELTYTMQNLEIITIADWLEKFLVEEYGRKVHRVVNGVGPEFNPDATPPERVTNKEFVVLVEGSAHNMAKDIAFMAPKVAAELKDRAEIWVFTHDENYAAAFNGIADQVFVQPPQDRIPGIYAGSDVLVKCSRFEGRPCPIAEAMACGCVPVVALQEFPWGYSGGDDLSAIGIPIFGYGDVISTVAFAESAIDLKMEAIRHEMSLHVQQALQWPAVAEQLEKIFQSTPERWQHAQHNEAAWWTEYIQNELGNPTRPVLVGHRREALKRALNRFGFWRDQNLGALPKGNWLDVGSGPVSMLHGLEDAAVVAIDPLMDKYAAELEQCALGPVDNVHYRKGSAEHAAENYRQQGNTWCYNVLDHTANWKQSLENICQTVAIGGELWLMTHLRPVYRLDAHHTQSFESGQVLNVILEQGLILVGVQTHHETALNLPAFCVRARREA